MKGRQKQFKIKENKFIAEEKEEIKTDI